MSRAARKNGPAYPDEVVASVRARLGWEPLPVPDRAPEEIMPPEAQADPALVRRLLRTL